MPPPDDTPVCTPHSPRVPGSVCPGVLHRDNSPAPVRGRGGLRTKDVLTMSKQWACRPRDRRERKSRLLSSPRPLLRASPPRASSWDFTGNGPPQTPADPRGPPPVRVPVTGRPAGLQGPQRGDPWWQQDCVCDPALPKSVFIFRFMENVAVIPPASPQLKPRGPCAAASQRLQGPSGRLRSGPRRHSPLFWRRGCKPHEVQGLIFRGPPQRDENTRRPLGGRGRP